MLSPLLEMAGNLPAVSIPLYEGPSHLVVALGEYRIYPKVWHTLIHSCLVDCYLNFWTGPFQIEGVSDWLLLLPYFIGSTVFYAHSVDPV